MRTKYDTYNGWSSLFFVILEDFYNHFISKQF